MTDYLIHIQYLGFRFHGWQRQPGVKTVESMLVKTFDHILEARKFKILGSSRTDAMVSAVHAAFVLSVDGEMGRASLLTDLNHNLPPDIRALAVETAPPGFNIINSPKTKTYHYYFSQGEKAHPFCAPFLTSFQDALDLRLMRKGAVLFEGTHDFSRYCTRPGQNTRVRRTILLSRVEENKGQTASFFPEQTWVYRVRSRGFMRNQVRLMMGQLICLGQGEIGLEQIEESLCGPHEAPLRPIAPASGLVLHHIEFDHIKQNPELLGDNE